MSLNTNGTSKPIPKFDCHLEPALLGPQWNYLKMVKVELLMKVKTQPQDNEEQQCYSNKQAHMSKTSSLNL